MSEQAYESVRIKLTPEEKNRLMIKAFKLNKSMSEILREGANSKWPDLKLQEHKRSNPKGPYNR